MAPETEWNPLNSILPDKLCSLYSEKIITSCLANKFHILNGKQQISWLNKSIMSYKIECNKNFFLTCKIH